jgi:hypothetical protein
MMPLIKNDQGIKMAYNITSTALVCAFALGAFSSAYAEKSFEDALKEGEFYVDLRYRYEHADQANLSEQGHASTLRTRAGYKSGVFHDVSGVVELDYIQQLGADNYNDTLNGRTNLPVVADIESKELNQAFLQFDGIKDTRLRVGREAINLDNQRFIGSVDWRQNNQTLDVVSLVNKSLEDTKITYAYMVNVNRIFGEESPNGDFESDSHLINLSHDGLSIGTLTAYGYLLDFENDAPRLSSQTFGASLTGKQSISEKLTFKYHLEYAHQSDYSDNPVSYDASYYHIAPALAYGGFTATLGYEVLGSDGGQIGFSTPLATAHKFNGWADLFLATPATGLRDAYIDLTYKAKGIEGEYAWLNGLLLKLQYHDFSAESGGVDYGTEIDFYAKKPFQEHYFAELKVGDYNADQFGNDLQRVIFGLGASF